MVYGRPAIAAPLSALRAVARIAELSAGSPSVIEAPDLGHVYRLDQSSPGAAGEALQTTVRNTLLALGDGKCVPPFRLTVSSSVPIASGMGSGTAVATAIVRTLASWLGAVLPPEEVSALVFRTEQLLHGTPSGVDNTVVAYEQPVYFCAGTPPELLDLGAEFHWVIGDTGIRSQTRHVVADVQRWWQAERIRYDALFDGIADAVVRARRALASGQPEELGHLMDVNQALLSEMGVSCGSLDRLVAAARSAGALGAKLSGGGQGGIMIALVRAGSEAAVERALRHAGAVRTLRTALVPGQPPQHREESGDR